MPKANTTTTPRDQRLHSREGVTQRQCYCRQRQTLLPRGNRCADPGGGVQPCKTDLMHRRGCWDRARICRSGTDGGFELTWRPASGRMPTVSRSREIDTPRGGLDNHTHIKSRGAELPESTSRPKVRMRGAQTNIPSVYSRKRTTSRCQGGHSKHRSRLVHEGWPVGLPHKQKGTK